MMTMLAVGSVFIVRFLVLTYRAACWAGHGFGLIRRAHEPRLWPIALVDVTTQGGRVRLGEVHYELGEFNPKLGRVCVR